MKRCPKCQTDYFDDTLEFCLEDGARLALAVPPATQVTKSAFGNPSAAKTVSFSDAAPLRTAAEPLEKAAAVGKALETTVKTKSFEALAVAPLVFALLHNWAQWLYVSNQSYGSLGALLVSPQFAGWLVLLAGGAISGLLALKFCAKKGLAYIGLFILAVNLLLFLVPKR